jgi:DtxR family Mn-dependent transcriptional regulator
MAVASPSVTAMLKKLMALGLVEHEPYRGAALTPAGEKVAIEMVRHHRLLEQYLAEALGLSIDAVHDEAHRLEHALSEEVEARIDESLGFPTHDPHGDPIPDAELNVATSNLRPLTELEPGEQATIRRIPDGEPELLRYLSELALVPGARVEVAKREPLTVAVGSRSHVVAPDVAARIGVAVSAPAK